MNASARHQLRLRVADARREQITTSKREARQAKQDYLARRTPRTTGEKPEKHEPAQRTCGYCGAQFSPAVHNQRFCTRTHQERAYRQTPHGLMLERRRKRAQRARLRQMAL